MDHLFLPDGAHLSEHDLVPYVASEDYEGVSFSQYIQKPGKLDLLNSAGFGGSLDELGCLFQTWLVFSFLQEVLGPHFHFEKYITRREQVEGPEKLYLTTKVLREAVLEQRSAWSGTMFDEQMVNEITGHVHAGRQAMNRCPDLRGIVLSTLAVVAILPSIATRSSVSFSPELRTSADYLHVTDLKLMQSQGWCAHDARRQWMRATKVEAQMFLRCSRRADGFDHRACEPPLCRGQADPSDAHEHEASCCQRTSEGDWNCDQFTVDSELAAKIVAAGKYVLLEVQPTLPARQRFNIVESKAVGRPYTAISHVWAHGLGNSASNELPICRLLKVAEKVENLLKVDQMPANGKPFWIWLDTLCCPVEPLWAKAECIARMARIYREAAQVLVLDAALQRYQIKKTPNLSGMNYETIIEAFIQIRYSQWMLRLWTFQEGAFAIKLYFQFQNMIVRSNCGSELFDYENDPDFWGLVAEVMSLLDPLETFFAKDAEAQTFESLYGSVCFRSVSVATDEALCLSAMIGGDVPAAATTDPQNMQHFWQTCVAKQMIRSHQIFHAFPRLEIKGFRWAPRSLLSTTMDNSRIFTAEALGSEASLTSKGLHTTLQGLVFKNKTTDSGSIILPKILIEEEHLCSFFVRSLAPPRYFGLTIDNDTLEAALEDKPWQTDIAVLLRHPNPDDLHQRANPVVAGLLTTVVSATDIEPVQVDPVVACYVRSYPTSLNEQIENIIRDPECAFSSILANRDAWREFLRHWGWDDSWGDEYLRYSLEQDYLNAQNDFWLSGELLPETQGWIIVELEYLPFKHQGYRIFHFTRLPRTTTDCRERGIPSALPYLSYRSES